MSKKLTELPHPQGNLILGNSSAFARNQLDFLTKCAAEYGDIVPLRLGVTPACLLNRPDYIEQVLKNRELFVKRGDLLRNILGEGLITARGESWFKQRRLVQPVFHQKRIANYGEVMVDYTERLLETWQNGEIRDIHADMSSVTLDIVVKTIFNIDFNNTEAKTIGNALSESLNWIERQRKEIPVIGKLFSLPGNLRFQKAIGDMDETIYKVIHQRRQEAQDNGDLLSMLIQAEDEADGSSMNDKQLRDEVATLMIAGHETTANSLAWAWML
ncbi:MAG: cytochrome P450, partial [Cyanobacteriota bacterium]|nr:cytochrome P450 [Cyanobacteriota bacterium]